MSVFISSCSTMQQQEDQHARLTKPRLLPLKEAEWNQAQKDTLTPLKKYFKDLNGHKPGELYDLVLGEVEPPLFQTVMDYTQGNQSRAAQILGISRSTLRKKLKSYGLD